MHFLNQVAKISSGLSFRGKIAHQADAALAVLQMRDLSDGYTALSSDCVRIHMEPKYEKHLLAEGDVLLLSKGGQNHAVRYEASFGPALATAVFFVIRPEADKLDPGYLLWYLNHPKTQQHFKQLHTGTYTPSLNKEAVELLEIPLPSLARQRLIGQVQRCHTEEVQLQNRLAALREHKVQSHLYQKILQNT